MAEKASPSPSGSKEEKSNVWKKIAAGSLLAAVAFTGCSSNPEVTPRDRKPAATSSQEIWTLDKEAFNEYIVSLPSKAEQVEAYKIPLGLSDADMGRAVTDRLCSAINFGIDQELRDVFNNSGEIKNEQDTLLRKASIEQVAADISERNNILESLYFDKYPGVATYEDEYFGIVQRINKSSISKYISNQDSEPTTCTPVAIEPIEYANSRGFRLLYRYDGGLNETKLKKDIDIPGVASGNGFIKFSINEDGGSVLIDDISEGEFWEVDPENWYVY